MAKRLGNYALQIQWPLLGVLVVAFWFPLSIRAEWTWLLLLFVPIMLLHWWLERRLISTTPIVVLSLVLLILGVLNVVYAPYTWGLVMLGRPLLGVLIIYTFVETSRLHGNVRIPLLILVGLAVFIGALALFTTQWNEKSASFDFLLNYLPRWRDIPGFEGGFNANELSGALAWLLPPMAGLAVYRWAHKLPRVGVTLAFVLLFLALILGQGRMAIIGTLVALAVVIYLLVPTGKWRRIAWVALVAVTVFELVLIFNPAERERLEARDEISFTTRLYMWQASLEIVRDHPLTGVGMNMYRTRVVRDQYPVPGYENRVLPHTHNEMLQLGTDLGVPGLILFVALVAVVGYMTWVCWRSGDAMARAVSVSMAAGLLAHGIFGMADAITFWDRFAFVLWILLGILAAQYTLVTVSQKT
ncbi:MAG: O-antigen ligase family protein [Anaerolineae bacterium]|nr:O-antigen ligase family protein [Anaerolineae bacterium]